MRVRPTIIREDSHQIAASAAAAAMTNDMSHINAYSAGSIATNDSNDQLFLIREERLETIRNLVFFGLSQGRINTGVILLRHRQLQQR